VKDAPGGDAPRTSPVQSVDRAVTILEVLAELGESGVTEISQRLDVHKSTAFRLVTALEGRGLVEQVGDRGKYRLGMAVVRLAGAVADQLDVTRRARPACEELAAATGETVNVAVADGDAAINVDQVRGASSVVTHNWVGERTPLHATSSGKVLMAFCPPVRSAGVSGRLRRFTDATLVRRRDLEEVLDKIAVDGYATTLEELEVGLPRRGRAGARPRRDGRRGDQRLRSGLPPHDGTAARGRPRRRGGRRQGVAGPRLASVRSALVP
jgi:IclR family acetate operon transcriptional repressor